MSVHYIPFIISFFFFRLIPMSFGLFGRLFQNMNLPMITDFLLKFIHGYFLSLGSCDNAAL